MGTSAATIRFAKMGHINFKIALSCSITAILGSFLGASLSVYTNERIIQIFILILLPILFVYLLFTKKDFDSFARKISKTTYIASILSAFVIGVYDGFYGPGTGTFLLILYTGVAKLPVSKASGTMKLANLSSNVMALAVFLFSGKIVILLGLAASAFSIAGHYVGSGMVMKNGSKIVRPIILVVLALLFIKIITGM